MSNRRQLASHLIRWTSPSLASTEANVKQNNFTEDLLKSNIGYVEALDLKTDDDNDDIKICSLLELQSAGVRSSLSSGTRVSLENRVAAEFNVRYGTVLPYHTPEPQVITLQLITLSLISLLVVLFCLQLLL